MRVKSLQMCNVQFKQKTIIKSNVQTENESASTSSTLLDKVPPVFKKCPFWPKENTSSVKKKKNERPEYLPLLPPNLD